MKTKTILVSFTAVLTLVGCGLAQKYQGGDPQIAPVTSESDPMEVFLDYLYALNRQYQYNAFRSVDREKSTDIGAVRVYRKKGITWHIRQLYTYNPHQIISGNETLYVCRTPSTSCSVDFLSDSMGNACKKLSGVLRGDGWCVSESKSRHPLFYYSLTVTDKNIKNEFNSGGQVLGLYIPPHYDHYYYTTFDVEFIAPKSKTDALSQEWRRYAVDKGFVEDKTYQERVKSH